MIFIETQPCTPKQIINIYLDEFLQQFGAHVVEMTPYLQHGVAYRLVVHLLTTRFVPFPSPTRGLHAQPNHLISSFRPARLAFVRENVDGVLAIVACAMKKFFQNATLLFFPRSLIPSRGLSHQGFSFVHRQPHSHSSTLSA